MSTLATISLLADGLTTVIQLTTKLQEASAMLQKARMEGREVSDAEYQAVRASLKSARDRLAGLVT
jgi:5-bromo-4-chloroindolyl phosphate hydrolysis protein